MLWSFADCELHTACDYVSCAAAEVPPWRRPPLAADAFGACGQHVSQTLVTSANAQARAHDDARVAHRSLCNQVSTIPAA